MINASGIHIRNSNLTSSLSRLELLSSASSAYANSTFSSATSRVSLDQLQDCFCLCAILYFYFSLVLLFFVVVPLA